MRIVLLREIPEDVGLGQRWNALVSQTEKPQVFYTYEWSLAVQRAYHARLRPLLFLGYDARESLCGLAALAANPAGSQVSFLCATTGDYCDFLSTQGQKAAFVAAVLTQIKEQALGDVILTNLPADSDTVAAIRSVSGSVGYHCFTRTAYVCAQISLSELERRPGESKPILPRKKMVRRFLSAMGREAPVRLDHARSWEAVQPVLPEFMQAHVARFLFTGRISNIAQPERRRFLEELAKLLGESGWLTLTRLMSGEGTMAWNYGFQFADTWFWYQPTFDSDLEKYSPGFCLLSRLVEEAANDPSFKIVDMGLGAEEYKDRFANQSRETLYVTLRASAIGSLRDTVRYRLSKAVRTWPFAERAIRTFADRATAFRQRLQRMGLRPTCIWIARRAQSSIVARDEVFFYELTNPRKALPNLEGVCLKSIDLDTLAAAAMQNADDEETLTYLLRCAQRLQTDTQCSGFALISSAGEYLHFTWSGLFEGFRLAELNGAVPPPVPGAILLFDSWTPISHRGRGYYAPTLELVVAGLRREGKRAWIFSASTNVSSVRGLEKAGFQRSFSACRYRFLWWQKIVQRSIVPSLG